MKKILITGWEGFIGSNLFAHLKKLEDIELLKFGSNQSIDELKLMLNQCDLIFHLAGINRHQLEEEFHSGNVELTDLICKYLISINKNPKIIFSSSIQIENENIYGKTKLMAEKILKKYHKKSNSEIAIYRLPGIFGKWSKPNYNTVVATFCNNIARNLPIEVSDKDKKIDLVYIDDLISDFKNEINHHDSNKFRYKKINPIYNITLGELVEKITFFHQSRDSLLLPDFKDLFMKKLHATFLSFLPRDDFAYNLTKMSDDRGVLAEFIKSKSKGQIFVSTTNPGKTRGNHYHHTKIEKFLILSGNGLIRFKSIIKDDEVFSYEINGKELKVVDIPPGYTHSIQNIGEDKMVVLFWSSEIFNKDNPDTDYFPVQE
tara:strand:+ start:1988 stop:3109 length:1122 start_codon:yes stop_codon:yes gene_type:complete